MRKLRLGLIAAVLLVQPFLLWHTHRQQQRIQWRIALVGEINAATERMNACRAEIVTNKGEPGPTCKDACAKYNAFIDKEQHPPAWVEFHSDKIPARPYPEICGGETAVIKPLSTTCRKPDIKKTESGCKQDASGAVECHSDFLQPQTWGRCLMEKDSSLDCESKGLLSHYPEGAASPDWSAKAEDCSEMAEQIKKLGQGEILGIQIEIPVDPEPKPLPSSTRGTT
jgi:hypothetical protein